MQDSAKFSILEVSDAAMVLGTLILLPLTIHDGWEVGEVRWLDVHDGFIRVDLIPWDADISACLQ